MPVKALRVSLGFAIVASAVACNNFRGNSALAAGEVSIDLTCDGGIFSATVRPWRVRMSQMNGKKAIKFKLNNSSHSVDSAVIDSVEGRPWPFKTTKFSVKKGYSVDADSADTYSGPEATYHYRISTVCIFGGVTDTIVIDPDMILPPRN